MKSSFKLLLCLLLTGSAHAEFRTWTRNDGKTAEMELISVAESNGAAMGEFKMRNGRTVSVGVASFSEADAKILSDWKPSDTAAASSEVAAPNAFEKALDGNLVKLSGKSLKTCKDATKPTKYYLFYYSASWCGPCHKFTPSLVDFYNKNKDASFELVLVTSDSDEGAMDEYAAEFKMPWPQLKLSKVSRFKKDHPYPGGGIPNLVLTDLEGNLIKGSYEGETYLGPAVVMNHLGSLLKK
ncbi:MAG: thioredoxin-like domain-containing protein [Verrucomicrobiota bacterium]